MFNDAAFLAQCQHAMQIPDASKEDRKRRLTDFGYTVVVQASLSPYRIRLIRRVLQKHNISGHILAGIDRRISHLTNPFEALRAAEQERAQQEAIALQQQQERERRRALSSRPRKPCPKCGRKTPLELCRKCEADKGKLPCSACGELTRNVHEILAVSVCDQCNRTKEQFKLITKTTAKNDYGLNDDELQALNHIDAVNPHYKSGPPMRLYLRAQVDHLSSALPVEERNFCRRLKRLGKMLEPLSLLE
jgi:hypothetical protein